MCLPDLPDAVSNGLKRPLEYLVPLYTFNLHSRMLINDQQTMTTAKCIKQIYIPT